jgi:hypothetical protein
LPQATFVVMAAAMIELSSTAQLLSALSTAQSVDVQAYTLEGPVFYAIETAAKRGARVAVHLEASPFADPKHALAKRNQQLVDELRLAGVDARLEHPLHAKAIDVDGTLYLDDKNWHANDLVLRDNDPADIASIPMKKSDALKQEADLLRKARSTDDVVVESESFGGYNPVYYALKALCKNGQAPRLLVSANDLRGNAKERAVVDELATDGVRVRVCKDSEKLACIGDDVWVGSANATAAFDKGEMPDWGVTSADATIVAAVHDRLEKTWNDARPLKRQKA